MEDLLSAHVLTYGSDREKITSFVEFFFNNNYEASQNVADRGLQPHSYGQMSRKDNSLDQ